MSALPLEADDLAAARALIVEAQALVAVAAVHIQQVRDVQPRTRKGHLMPGAVNVWGIQNSLGSATRALGHAMHGIDRVAP